MYVCLLFRKGIFFVHSLFWKNRFARFSEELQLWFLFLLGWSNAKCMLLLMIRLFERSWRWEKLFFVWLWYYTNVAFSGFSGLLGEVVCNKTLLNKEKCYITNINSMTASSAYTMVNKFFLLLLVNMLVHCNIAYNLLYVHLDNLRLRGLCEDYVICWTSYCG
jgi:hypothetical protein